MPNFDELLENIKTRFKGFFDWGFCDERKTSCVIKLYLTEFAHTIVLCSAIPTKKENDEIVYEPVYTIQSFIRVSNKSPCELYAKETVYSYEMFCKSINSYRKKLSKTFLTISHYSVRYSATIRDYPRKSVSGVTECAVSQSIFEYHYILQEVERTQMKIAQRELESENIEFDILGYRLLYKEYVKKAD